MKLRYFSACALLFLINYSCKSPDNGSVNSESKVVETAVGIEGKYSGPEYRFLTVGHYEYDAIVKVIGKVPPEEYKGMKIDFHEDGTYKTVLRDEINQGSWECNLEKETLTLKPENGKKSQWTFRPGEMRMILVGTKLYDDSGTQMRWYKHSGQL